MIADLWNYQRNGDLTPFDISAGSHQKYWWKCNYNHEWKTSPRDITGCPFCSGRRACLENNLLVKYPNIAKEWHSNNVLQPQEVVPGSSKKVWWKCSVNSDHEWQAVILCRAIRGDKCPYCACKKVCSSNCLEFLFPEIAKEWNYELNCGLIPRDVVAGSQTKVWWKCKNNHIWLTKVVNRTRNLTGCPKCNSVSKGEKLISNYLELNDIKYEYQYLIDAGLKRKSAIDFYLNELNLAIEYHGEQHYIPTPFNRKIEPNIKFLEQVVNRDSAKELYCKKNNIDLLIIPFWNFKIIDICIRDFLAGRSLPVNNPPESVRKYEIKRLLLILKNKRGRDVEWLI